MIFMTERLFLRPWEETDAGSLYEYAKDPDVGPIAGWPVHQSIEESREVIKNVFQGKECYAVCEKGTDRTIGAIELKLNGSTDMTERDDECELGFLYHHTCDEVPVPLLNEVRVGHTNYMTRDQWKMRKKNCP